MTETNQVLVTGGTGKAGRYVVDHCDVLIALWDGKPSRGKGGTAEIIEYARKRGRPLIIVSTSPPFKTTIEKGNGLNVQSLREIESFNAFSINDGVLDTYIENMYRRTFDNSEGSKLSEESKLLIRDKLLPFYVRASLIAKKNQKYYLCVGLAVYALSAAAIGSVAFGVLFRALSFQAFFVEAILLTAILMA